MSWLSESVVIYKRDMENMQSRGLRGLDLKTIVLVFDAQFQALRQGSKLRPFWSHMLPKCNLCDSKIYLGAFVRVQIIAVVRPLQFSAKRSRNTARMCHVTGS